MQIAGARNMKFDDLDHSSVDDPTERMCHLSLAGASCCGMYATTTGEKNITAIELCYNYLLPGTVMFLGH